MTFMNFFDNIEIFFWRTNSYIFKSWIYIEINHKLTHTFLRFSRFLELNLISNLYLNKIRKTRSHFFAIFQVSKSWICIWNKSERLTHTFLRFSRFLELNLISNLYLNYCLDFQKTLNSSMIIWSRVKLDVTIWKIEFEKKTRMNMNYLNLDSITKIEPESN